MINLLSGGGFTYAIKHNLNPEHFGLLTSPSSANSPQHAVDRNLPWACDNDCFLNYNPIAIYNMLKKYGYSENEVEIRKVHMNTKTENQVEPREIWDKLTSAQKRELHRSWCAYHPANSSSSRIADGRIAPKLTAMGLLEKRTSKHGWTEYIISEKGFRVYLSTLKPEDQAKNLWKISTLNSE